MVADSPADVITINSPIAKRQQYFTSFRLADGAEDVFGSAVILLARQLTGDHADHQLVQPLHMIVRQVRLGVGAADAGVVRQEQELTAGEQGPTSA